MAKRAERTRMAGSHSDRQGTILTMTSEAPIFNKLTLRMIAPVVLVVCSVGIGFYFFVLRTISDYAEQEIRASLARTAREIYDICDSNFTTLLQNGQMGNAKMVRIRRALTLGAIEDYAKRHNLRILLRERKEKVLLSFQIDSALLANIAKIHQKTTTWNLRIENKVYYFHHFDFKPWVWHIDLISDTTPFTPLIDRVKAVYAFTIVVLLLGLSVMIFALARGLRNPVQQIIAAVREKRPPDYRGIYEFEFLSHNIAEMMSSLNSHTQWLERLYTIGTTHRGIKFFRAIARVIADAMGLNTVIIRAEEKGTGFCIMAVAEAEAEAEAEGYNLELGDLANGLPCELLNGRSEPTVIQHGATEQFAAYKGIVANKPECYIGLAISDRNGRTIGCAHLFGEAREINDWDMQFVKTIGRMVGSEFELMEKEQDQKRISEQMLRSQKLESLGLLAGGVAHDLNNVLSGIVSYPEVLLLELPQDSKYRKAIETIQESGNRAAAIVQDLLTITRGVATTKKPLNLNELVKEYLDSPEFNKLKSFHPTVTVQTNFDTDLFNINGSHIHIRKTIMNLVSNASEAIEGEGNVTISTMNRYIDRPLKGYDDVKTGEYAILSISDDGPGIASDDLQRIFEPFYTKKKMGKSGTGLGLSVVWNVVQDHEGYVDVKSNENETIFDLYFPLTRDEISEKELPLSLEDLKGEGETILVVDDVESQRDISCKMLDTLGYKAVAVGSGEEAVEYLKGNTVDLILLDMIMDPGIDGCEAYKRIIAINPDQKAVIISGFAKSNNVKEAQKLGAGRYIKKPVTLEKLGLAVKEALEK
jgi:two-component system cell cycle sensor histidine kinase/response regulator CckA